MEIKKIIRDDIPAIAASEGNPMLLMVVDDNKALELLLEKIQEEVDELKEEVINQMEQEIPDVGKVLLEMADVRDVMEAIRQKMTSIKRCKHSDGINNIQDAHTRKARNGRFARNICMMK